MKPRCRQELVESLFFDLTCYYNFDTAPLARADSEYGTSTGVAYEFWMFRSTRIIVTLYVLAFAALVPATVRAPSCQDLRDLGDQLTWGIPVAAAAITGLKRDAEGGLQFARTAVFTAAGTGFFKAVGEKTRPDAGTSRQSFVSGHTSGAFIGASYLYTRYGKGWGIPAYGLAILTAYSRVCAQKHFADDVLGGALVAMMANWYSTSPHPDSGRLYPSFTSNGIELSFSGFFDGNRQPRDIESFRPRYRMVFEFGPVVQDKNIIRSPNDGSTIIDLEALEAEFHMTARMTFERYFDSRHELQVWYGPMGMTDFASPTQPFTVGNVTFDPDDGNGEIFDSNYRWWDLRGTWRYRLVDNEKWRVRAGVGLQYSVTEFEVEQRAMVPGPVNQSYRADESVLAPVLHFAAAYNFNDRWSIETDFDGMTLGDEYYWNSALWLRYRASPLWDFSIGGRVIHGKLDRGSLFNEVEVSDLTFQIGRSF